jgi:membrane-associated protein
LQSILEFFRQVRDPEALIHWGGYIGLTAIIFAETGLLIGFFLPGDSLLVTAGLLAATTGVFNVYELGALLTIASIVGNSAGYAIGRVTGRKLFTREDSLLFNKKHLYRAHDFYERHGGATVILARFMPIVRTFVPVVAGMAQMGYREYTLYNVVGGVLWIWSMLFIGYFLGRYIPGVDQHIESVILIVVLLSLSPGIIGWLRARRAAGRSTPPAGGTPRQERQEN